MYAGYQLSEYSKNKLLKLFPPKYSRIYAHHITTRFGTNNKDDIPPYTEDVQVVGYADSSDGIEALIVSINGDSKKDDGNLFHITWSLDPNHYQPFDSNKVVKQFGVTLPTPTPIQVEPKLFTATTPYTDTGVKETFLDYLKKV